jgi:hypothetical protein
MRHIRLFQRGNLVRGQFHVHGCESVVEMVQFGGADDRGCNDRLGEQPRQRHLGPGNASRCRNLGYAINDLAVCLRGFRAELVAQRLFDFERRAAGICCSLPIRQQAISSIEHTFSTGRQVSTAARMRSW